VDQDEKVIFKGRPHRPLHTSAKETSVRAPGAAPMIRRGIQCSSEVGISYVDHRLVMSCAERIHPESYRPLPKRLRFSGSAAGCLFRRRPSAVADPGELLG